MPAEPVSAKTLFRDAVAGTVVFLVALPLCLGIAQASGAEPIAGMLAGIVGGLVVGALSGSHTSVSGPAAGLTAIVAAQISGLGSYESFLLAVVIAGVIQVVLGLLRAGFIAAYFPMSVIRGLLTAIGVILIIKQLPHLLGRDVDPEGDMSVFRVDHENAMTEMIRSALRIHPGAALVGLSSLALLVIWDKVKVLKKSIIPAPFFVVLLGVGLSEALKHWAPAHERWHIGIHHLVQVPVVAEWSELSGFLRHPDFSQWLNPAIYVAALTIAAVASLESLLNLEAVDKLDPRRRDSPQSQELFAQGMGNVVTGLLGGIPVTSVIVRGSVNISAGARSKASAIFHGAMLALCLVFMPTVLNRIPLSCLAAVLLVTGFKLASPKIVRDMWAEGWNRFLPYVITVAAIVFADLLIGVVIGLVVSIMFILYSNLHRPLRHIVEQHATGDVHRIELASQLSFLNRAILNSALRKIPIGSQLLLDARNTVYIDPDVVDFIKEYQTRIAPAHEISVSLLGFENHSTIQDKIEYVDYSSRDLQRMISPPQVLELLKRGNQRFRENRPLTRFHTRQASATATGQFPMAAILSCIDSRAPVELIFDLGLGDIFTARIAGNIISDRVLGSLEYACKVAGAKLVVVLGHTRCGAVSAAVDLLAEGVSAMSKTGCDHLDAVTREVQQAISESVLAEIRHADPERKEQLITNVAGANVLRVVSEIRSKSVTLGALEQSGDIDIVGGVYNIATGEIKWLVEPAEEPAPLEGLRPLLAQNGG
jgi:carbonic anhydrase/SulP family sulfate permease